MSPKIYSRVEQIFLYKAGLSLNSDVTVPFLKSKNIAPKTVFLFKVDAGLVPLANQEPPSILTDSPPYPTRVSGRPGGLSNVPHKCTLIRFFCKVNNISN